MGFRTYRLAAAAALTLSAGAAHATTISYSHRTAGPLYIPFTDLFTLPGFDVTLGMLNSATITVAATITTIAQVSDSGSTNDHVTGVSASLPVTLTGPNAFSITETNTAGPYSGTVPANTPNLNLGSTSNAYTQSTAVSSSDLPFYEASGRSDVSFSFFSGTVLAGGSGVPGQDKFGGDGNASADITVAYDYTAPPSVSVGEPASLAVLGAGLLGWAVIRRRSRV